MDWSKAIELLAKVDADLRQVASWISYDRSVAGHYGQHVLSISKLYAVAEAARVVVEGWVASVGDVKVQDMLTLEEKLGTLYKEE